MIIVLSVSSIILRLYSCWAIMIWVMSIALQGRFVPLSNEAFSYGGTPV